jgi:DNA-binding MarR family transcriptional regulator/GNAT superfamily N-acetyltransferase
MMSDRHLIERSIYMRQFTRFYTQKAGVLTEALLGSPYTLTEARLIYELATQVDVTARQLCEELELDPGYISRCLKKLEQKKLVSKTVDTADRRKYTLSLTELGLSEFKKLDHKSSTLFQKILSDLNGVEQSKLITAMIQIEKLLKPAQGHTPPVIFRPHKPGDMGWIIKAHGEIYAAEYGWNIDFEQLVAEIAANFLKDFKPEREICWIAELAGERIGAAMIVEQDSDTAKLRLVILDPLARGMGIGQRLVEQCMDFARGAGYSQLSLWTNSNLHAAIRIYENLGFTLQSEEPHHSFGKDLVGQHWSRPL